MTQKVEFFKDLIYNDQHVAVKVMMETQYSKEIRILFKEGQNMREHQTDFPITVQVLKGTIEFAVCGAKHLLNEGDMIALDPKTPHDLLALTQSIVHLSLSKEDSVGRVLKVIE